VATEARPAFIPITGGIERETLDAADRFAQAVREAADSESRPLVALCSALSARAFAGDREAWGPLVAAVGRLLARSAAIDGRALRSRRELRAFVAENADLLEA
jgi:hypothetical protein